MKLTEIIEKLKTSNADIVMLGHSGSSSAHQTVLKLCKLLRKRLPKVLIVYGGVHPTYMWDEILTASAEIDIIVRGEGEQTCVSLMQALMKGDDLASVNGIAYRKNGIAVATAPAQMLKNLDDYRIGWELIDHRNYSYWGGKRAVVVQFSGAVLILAATVASAASGPNGVTGIQSNWRRNWLA